MNLLLVDDDTISINILAQYIKPHLPHIDGVLCAYDGDEAFDIVLSVHPDIIVTDIKMPTVTGIELIKKIRGMADYDPYIIIISGYNDFSYARDALQLHVMDYILKPIDQDELIEKINNCNPEANQIEEHQDQKDVIEQVKKYVANHLDESFTLLEIAEKFHYNAAYLGRLIKKNTESSFTDYVLKLRVLKAKSLLINTNEAIKLIAPQVGFQDPEHFTKRFKKVTGTTPSSYRKEHQ